MPNFTVQDVRTETVTKGRNTYQKATVVYTNNKGENKEKGVMSFSNPSVYKLVTELKSGDSIDVEFAKDDPYFNWAKVTKVDGGEAPQSKVSSTSTAKTTVSAYETRDERILRQLHIVRQSSVSSAVGALVPGAKAPIKLEDLLEYAQGIVDFVYAEQKVNLAEGRPEDEEVSFQ